MTATQRARLGVALECVALGFLLLGILIASTGGGRIERWGLRLSFMRLTNPVLFALVAAVASTWLQRWQDDAAPHSPARRILRAAEAHAHLIAIVLAAVMLAITIGFGIFVAVGSDASCYLAEARLLRAGTFEAPLTPLDGVRLSEGPRVFTPLGFTPASSATASVPICPPGLPLLMALADAIGGDGAAFAVVPLSAAGLVLVTFGLGRRLASRRVALLAAVGCAVSPLVLFHAIQPLSDIPAAFFSTLALFLLTSSTPVAPFAAGVSASMAALIRPNLFTLLPVIAMLIIWWHYDHRRGRRAALGFVLIPIVTALAFAIFQQTVYGGAAQSGYGPIRDLLSVDRVWPNLTRYARWLTEMHSPVLLLALAAPWCLPLQDSMMSALSPRRVAWGLLAVFGAVWSFYLLYLVFEEWGFTRFLLPALPAVYVLVAVTLMTLCRLLARGSEDLAVVVITLVVVMAGAARVRGLAILDAHQREQRYVEVARFVGRLPENSAMLSMQHSGSIAYYTGRTVLRWDWIDRSELDYAVQQLGARGLVVFAVLDGVELRQFCERFAGTAVVRRMQAPLFGVQPPMPPVFVYRVGVDSTEQPDAADAPCANAS